jgi:hypothetical protein
VALYDREVRFRHASVEGAEWVGYRLAWKGLAGIANSLLRDHPYKEWYPFYYDPAHPNDPSFGGPSELRRWDVWLVMAVGLPTVDGGDASGADAYNVQRQKADLEAFFNQLGMQIMTPGGWIYSARMFNLEIWLVNPYDLHHRDGSDDPVGNGEGRCGEWVAHVELVELPEP